MKRKAILAITTCTPKAFETWSFRDFLPFTIGDGRWSDYTIDHAFQLKLLMEAAQATDTAAASYLAARALRKMHPLDPFAFTGGDLWVALVRYQWDEAPEDWVKLGVIAGRWADLNEMAVQHVADQDEKAKLTSVLAFSAVRIAHDLLTEAREFGLPEGEVRQVPEDLTGYPEWFKDLETSRRALIFGSDKDAEA